MTNPIRKFMPRSKRTRIALGATAGGLLMAGAGAFAYAALVGGDAVIHACVDPRGGVRIIDAQSGHCFSNETLVTWNEKGQQGATGATGAVGATGAAGPAGPAGATGPAGVPGIPGSTGATGAPGSIGATGPAGPAGAQGPAGPAGGGGPGAPNRQTIGNVVFVGRAQGTIGGDGDAPVGVVSYQWNITTPIDPSSGLPTGKHQDGQFTITKQVDSASPRLMQALVTNETLSTVTLHILSASGDTLETFTFVNALLVSDTQSHTGAAGDLPLEQVSFSFQKVTETVGSFVTTDDRSGPPA